MKLKQKVTSSVKQLLIRLRLLINKLGQVISRPLSRLPRNSTATLGILTLSLAIIFAFYPVIKFFKSQQSSQAAQPILQRISPTIGAPAGGDKVILQGNSFQQSTSPLPTTPGTTVSIDGTLLDPSSIRYIDPYHLEITMPPHANGKVNITVTNPDGTSATLNQAYEYYTTPTPKITSVTPNQATIYGGEELTITGENLDNIRWKQVSNGGNHTCAISSDSKAYCWGATPMVNLAIAQRMTLLLQLLSIHQAF